MLILESIKSANPQQVDALWGILKYKEIGIFRKVRSMCEVLNLDFDEILEELPEREGRLIDKATRHLIHDVLVTVS